MPTFKRTMQELDGKIAQEQPKEAPKPVEPKQYNPAKEFNPKHGFVKPLAKWEAAEAKKQGISNDEYRYEKAKDYALLMGEQLPNKDKFMKDLAEKRGNPIGDNSEFSKARPAFTHDFAESLRKDAINFANEKMPYDKSLPKILNNYTRDEVIDFMRGNIGEDEIMRRAKERNGINQDRVNLLAKQEAQKPQPKKEPAKEDLSEKSENAAQEEEFNPTEPQGNYLDGAKTHSENEFLLEAQNDRGMYNYIAKNRDYLYRKANSDPQGAIEDVIRHGERNYGIDPKNIRKDYAMKVLEKFYEEGEKPDLTKQEEFKPTEQMYDYDDFYGAKTKSERNLNVLTSNDEGAYNYITNNRDALTKEAEYDPRSVVNKIRLHFKTPGYYGEVKPENIRKDYLIKVLKGFVED